MRPAARTRRRRGWRALVLLVCPASAWAQDVPTPPAPASSATSTPAPAPVPEPKDPCLKPSDAKNDTAAPIMLCRYSQYRQPAAGKFEVYNGTQVDPGDYPALFYFFGSGGLCTATLVASEVMLTAGHCVHDGGTVSVPATSWSTARAGGVCKVAAFAPDAPRLDLALCKLSKPMSGPYERINRDPELLAGTPSVTLIGFGCGAVAEPDPKEPVLRKGTTTVRRIEDGAVFTSGGASVCLGDSGGPAFRDTVASKASGPAKRVQIAVNSAGTDNDGSWLSLTSSPAAIKFITDWADGKDVDEGNGQKICGFDPHAKRCR